MLSERLSDKFDGLEHITGRKINRADVEEARELESELKAWEAKGALFVEQGEQVRKLEEQIESYNKYVADGQTYEGPQYWQERLDSQDRHIRKLETKNTELYLVLEEYPPEYMVEDDAGNFYVYCRACEGEWRHFAEKEEEEPQHKEYCAIQKALIDLEDGDE